MRKRKKMIFKNILLSKKGGIKTPSFRLWISVKIMTTLDLPQLAKGRSRNRTDFGILKYLK